MVYYFRTFLKAGIAQLVEHDLAKVGVASSNLVSRSNSSLPCARHRMLLQNRLGNLLTEKKRAIVYTKMGMDR